MKVNILHPSAPDERVAQCAGARIGPRPRLLAVLVSCCLGLPAATPSLADRSDGVVPITSEPDHKVRFDNGRVRLYEVVLPKGKVTLFHEHRADMFFVFLSTTEVTNELLGSKPVTSMVSAGSVSFTHTVTGPYSHRLTGSGDAPFHVLGLELNAPAVSDPGRESDRWPPFEPVLENGRGRAFRLILDPGQSTEQFTRPANTAVIALSAGRVAEHAEGKPAKLWDFESGDFRWVETGEALSLQNPGPGAIELVEIEVH